MTDLIILGGSRSVPDIVWMVREINRQSERFRLVAVLDDDASRHGTSLGGVPIVGPLAAVADFGTASFVVSVATYRRPTTRRDVVAKVKLPRERYATLVHPSAFVAPEARIGAGVLMFQSVLVASNTVIGDHTLIGPFCLVSHDVQVADAATLGPGVSMCGGSRLGAAAYLGARSVVKDGVAIGDAAVVGVGSIVIRDVAAGAQVFGNPARARLGGARGSTT